MERTDIHRPSAIQPEEYHFVACLHKAEDPIEEAAMLREFAIALRAHRKRTGGIYSQHEHAGTCHICGAGCCYIAVFHHQKTNTYIETGLDCAQKLEMGNAKIFRTFRTHIQDALKRRAGKAKAQAILEQGSMSEAWDVYAKEDHADDTNDQRVVCDIVGKLVQYGDISEGQTNYLRILLDRIKHQPEIDAARKIERDAAEPCPTGRHEVSGEILSTKMQESDYGDTLKMLVKTDEGFLLWGTVPTALQQAILIVDDYEYQGVGQGDRVRFTATITPSEKDEKFGFYKRPTKAEVIERGIRSKGG